MQRMIQRLMLVLLAAVLLAAVLLASSCNKSDSSNTNSSPDTTSQLTPPTEQAPAVPEVAETPPVANPGSPGSQVADFTLTDMSGKEHHLADYLASGKTVVLEWFNPGCSVVHYYYQETRSMHDTYEQVKAEMGDDVVWLAVISQDPGGSGGTDEEVNKAIAEWKLDYPLLRDGSGTVGKSFGAEATPALYVISPDGLIQYNGSVDEWDHGADPPIVGTNFVVQAVSELKTGTPVSVQQREAVG